MDEEHIDNSSDRAIKLQKEAEIIFPMPDKVCAYKRKKILWQRERWINQQIINL